jgi:hypothetical protein
VLLTAGCRGKLVHLTVDAGDVDAFARRVCGRRRIGDRRAVRHELPNDLTGSRLDAERYTALRGLKKHRHLSAPGPDLIEQNRCRIRVGAERNLPALVQAVDVSDRQRVFRAVEPAASRVETEDRPTGRSGGQKRRGEEAGDGGHRQE